MEYHSYRQGPQPLEANLGFLYVFFLGEPKKRNDLGRVGTIILFAQQISRRVHILDLGKNTQLQLE